MGWREDVASAARALRGAGVSVAEVEDGLLQTELAAIIDSAGDRLAITVAVRRLGPANQHAGRRVVVEMAKGGMSAPLIVAALPGVFLAPHLADQSPLRADLAMRRTVLVIGLTNTLNLQPEQVAWLGLTIRHIKATTGADL